MKTSPQESEHFFLRLICTLFSLGFSVSLFSQYNVQIRLDSTYSKDVYLAGNINNWNPADSIYRFKQSENGLVLEFQTTQSLIEFKLTQGSWTRVEKNNQGIDISNRKHQLREGNNILRLNAEKWGDGSSSVASTLSKQVSILSDSFYSHKLLAFRRVWIYLPRNYTEDSLRSYPVWYMHDGQNLFDNSTSFSGEWQVDEILDRLDLKGSNNAIIVGIDNGGAERLHEYSPWYNEKYKMGAKGESYINFIVEELKPFVDSTFRTLRCRQFTTIGGSSMGGLISLYALLAHQEVFGNALVFSPAFWFAKPELDSFLINHPIKLPSKIHFLAGKMEGPDVVRDMESVRSQLAESDLLEYDYVVRELGEHNEAFWASEFESAFKFLNSDPYELVMIEKDTWVPKSSPCPETIVNYTISKNMLPFYFEIEGGNVLNTDYNVSGQLIIEWDKNSSEPLLIIHKSRK
jgi:predicted alpha/beta superfamily hydrolase